MTPAKAPETFTDRDGKKWERVRNATVAPGDDWWHVRPIPEETEGERLAKELEDDSCACMSHELVDRAVAYIRKLEAERKKA
jgi:hypothetical protein